jgi:hypothetical protein
MALEKLLILNKLQLSYHRLISLTINTNSEDMFVVLGSYYSREDRLADINPVVQHEYNFKLDKQNPFYKDGRIMDQSYNELKKIPLFTEAKDV